MFELTSSILKYVFIIVIYMFIFSIIRLIYLDIMSMKRKKIPVGKGQPYLKLINQRNELSFKVQESYMLNGDMTVGRSRKNQIAIQDPFLSVQHAEFVLQDGIYFISDLNSTNGTFVNEDRLRQDPVILKNGDKISFGQIDFLFVETKGDEKYSPNRLAYPHPSRPIKLLVLINFITFILLFLFKQPFDEQILYAGGFLILSIALIYVLFIRKTYGDEYLFLIVSMLMSMGIMMLYRLDKGIGLKQMGWIAIGLLLFIATYYIYVKIKVWDKLMYLYLAFSIVLFIITLIFGKSIKGAKNWILIGDYSFQPAEIIKIAFVFFIASYFKYPEKITNINIKLPLIKLTVKSEYIFILFSFMHIGFLIIQREWGVSLLFFLVYITMLYTFTNNIKLLLLNIFIAIGGSITGYVFLYHIRVRVSTWINPWKDIAGKGYQITQSLFAIGAGGFFGTGLGLGSPEFIPEVHNDFIFSAVCEELGIFGGVAVILLFFILTYRGFKISLAVQDIFHKYIALGITLLFGFQTFIIIGGVIKLIPLTGITLPFISYGGSSLTSSFIALGILQGISNLIYGEEVDAIYAVG